ncbi:MAG TPA: FAD-dependent oxidoreductase [Actinoplanes sp.]|jgi:predicted NAD/FAD-binding protein
MTRRIAVVGAGVAGLSAAYHLRNECDVTLFEQSSVVGGHAHTVEVQEGERTLGLDTAFIVFNPVHYPGLTAFFADLDVASVEHRGGFNFFDLDSGEQFGSDELELPTETVEQLYGESFVRMHAEARRFYAQAPRDCVRGRAELPLGEYLQVNGYSDAFRYGFVMSLASAVWSVPMERIWEMPAATLITFFSAHGAGGLGGRSVQWHTVAGGSISYVRKAVAALGRAGVRIRTDAQVRDVHEVGDEVLISTDSGVESFDRVVLATHADQALAALRQPTAEQRMLADVRYNATTVLLHTDETILPAQRERWRSWNYGRVQRAGRPHGFVVYYLNELQSLHAEKDYFVTLDCPRELRDEKIIAELHYTHPILTVPVRRMQGALRAMNEKSRIKMCGSYFAARGIGPDVIASHEAAFDSGAAVAESVLSDVGGRTLSGSHRA